jgi:hypothetical protein
MIQEGANVKTGEAVTARMDREGNQLVSSLRTAYRDDFNGAALNLEDWEVVRNDVGQVISVAGGELTINAGTTANEQTIIRSKIPLSIPVRTWFIGRLSQRIANQTFWLELVNAAGDMAAQWKLDGVTATTAVYNALNGGNGTESVASAITYTATDVIFEIELFADEAWFVTRIPNGVNAKAANFCRTNNVPCPCDTYYAQIRVVNGATPPASATQLILGAVAIQDINEMTVEVTGGRGDSAAAKAISVAGTVTATVATTTLAGSTTNASGSFVNRVSLATNNATLVKATAGSLYWIMLTNNTASWRYVKFFNKATAPVPGTDTPTITIGIPPNDTVTVANAVGMRLPTGIGYAITAGVADLDNTAVGANEVVLAFNYT